MPRDAPDRRPARVRDRDRNGPRIETAKQESTREHARPRRTHTHTPSSVEFAEKVSGGKHRREVLLQPGWIDTTFDNETELAAEHAALLGFLAVFDSAGGANISRRKRESWRRQLSLPSEEDGENESPTQCGRVLASVLLRRLFGREQRHREQGTRIGAHRGDASREGRLPDGWLAAPTYVAQLHSAIQKWADATTGSAVEEESTTLEVAELFIGFAHELDRQLRIWHLCAPRGAAWAPELLTLLRTMTLTRLRDVTLQIAPQVALRLATSPPAGSFISGGAWTMRLASCSTDAFRAAPTASVWNAGWSALQSVAARGPAQSADDALQKWRAAERAVIAMTITLCAQSTQRIAEAGNVSPLGLCMSTIGEQFAAPLVQGLREWVARLIKMLNLTHEVCHGALVALEVARRVLQRDDSASVLTSQAIDDETITAESREGLLSLQAIASRLSVEADAAEPSVHEAGEAAAASLKQWPASEPRARDSDHTAARSTERLLHALTLSADPIKRVGAMVELHSSLVDAFSHCHAQVDPLRRQEIRAHHGASVSVSLTLPAVGTLLDVVQLGAPLGLIPCVALHRSASALASIVDAATTKQSTALTVVAPSASVDELRDSMARSALAAAMSAVAQSASSAEHAAPIVASAASWLASRATQSSTSETERAAAVQLQLEALKASIAISTASSAALAGQLLELLGLCAHCSNSERALHPIESQLAASVPPALLAGAAPQLLAMTSISTPPMQRMLASILSGFFAAGASGAASAPKLWAALASSTHDTAPSAVWLDVTAQLGRESAAMSVAAVVEGTIRRLESLAGFWHEEALHQTRRGADRISRALVAAAAAQTERESVALLGDALRQTGVALRRLAALATNEPPTIVDAAFQRTCDLFRGFSDIAASCEAALPSHGGRARLQRVAALRTASEAIEERLRALRTVVQLFSASECPNPLPLTRLWETPMPPHFASTVAFLSELDSALPGVPPAGSATNRDVRVVGAAVLATKSRPRVLRLVLGDGTRRELILKREDLTIDARCSWLLSHCRDTLSARTSPAPAAASLARGSEAHGASAPPLLLGQTDLVVTYAVTPLNSRVGLIAMVPRVQSVMDLLRREALFAAASPPGGDDAAGFGQAVDPAADVVMRLISEYRRELAAAVPEFDRMPRSKWPRDAMKQALLTLMRKAQRDLLARELFCHHEALITTPATLSRSVWAHSSMPAATTASDTGHPGDDGRQREDSSGLRRGKRGPSTRFDPTSPNTPTAAGSRQSSFGCGSDGRIMGAPEVTGPHAWFARQQRFTHSLAVMSALGHVAGIGDRHLDNIMIDFARGTVVHIDFNVAFGKGSNLRVPERVPFRITPLFMTAMGPQGAEGSFISTLSRTLSALAEPPLAMQLSRIAETFAYGPLHEWTVGASGHGGDEVYQQPAWVEFCDWVRSQLTPSVEALLQGIVETERLLHVEEIARLAAERAALTQKVTELAPFTSNRAESLRNDLIPRLESLNTAVVTPAEAAFTAAIDKAMKSLNPSTPVVSTGCGGTAAAGSVLAPPLPIQFSDDLRVAPPPPYTASPPLFHNPSAATAGLLGLINDIHAVWGRVASHLQLDLLTTATDPSNAMRCAEWFVRRCRAALDVGNAAKGVPLTELLDIAATALPTAEADASLFVSRCFADSLATVREFIRTRVGDMHVLRERYLVSKGSTILSRSTAQLAVPSPSVAAQLLAHVDDFFADSCGSSQAIGPAIATNAVALLIKATVNAALPTHGGAHSRLADLQLRSARVVEILTAEGLLSQVLGWLTDVVAAPGVEARAAAERFAEKVSTAFFEPYEDLASRSFRIGSISPGDISAFVDHARASRSAVRRAMTDALQRCHVKRSGVDTSSWSAVFRWRAAPEVMQALNDVVASATTEPASTRVLVAQLRSIASELVADHQTASSTPSAASASAAVADWQAFSRLAHSHLKRTRKASTEQIAAAAFCEARVEALAAGWVFSAQLDDREGPRPRTNVGDALEHRTALGASSRPLKLEDVAGARATLLSALRANTASLVETSASATLEREATRDAARVALSVGVAEALRSVASAAAALASARTKVADIAGAIARHEADIADCAALQRDLEASGAAVMAQLVAAAAEVPPTGAKLMRDVALRLRQATDAASLIASLTSAPINTAMRTAIASFTSLATFVTSTLVPRLDGCVRAVDAKWILVPAELAHARYGAACALQGAIAALDGTAELAAASDVVDAARGDAQRVLSTLMENNSRMLRMLPHPAAASAGVKIANEMRAKLGFRAAAAPDRPAQSSQSVARQLLEAAISTENLAEMYEGWTAWI